MKFKTERQTEKTQNCETSIFTILQQQAEVKTAKPHQQLQRALAFVRRIKKWYTGAYKAQAKNGGVGI